MRMALIRAAAIFSIGAIGGAHAEATCDSVRTDLTGQNMFGEHTMKELSDGAAAGNCDAASFLVRRAKDVQGFLATHCPAESDLLAVAGEKIRLGQDILKTPQCQD